MPFGPEEDNRGETKKHIFKETNVTRSLVTWKEIGIYFSENILYWPW